MTQGRERRSTTAASHVETPDLYGAFPRLSDVQIRALSAHGTRRETRPGDVLFREGDRACDFFVVVEGLVAIVEGHDVDEREIGLHGPGRFLGEIGLLTGEALFVTAVVREPGAVLVVPLEQLRQLVADDPALGDLILRAYLIRRTILIELGAGLRIIGSRFSEDTRRLRDFAARNRIPHRWIDLEDDAGAEQLLGRLGVRPEETPVVIWRSRDVLHNPSNAELAALIGLPAAGPGETVWDLVVVGAGPAGLSAVLYGASDGLSALVIDGVAPGGQAGTSTRIENYLGFPSGISGSELAERALVQAKKFGARFVVPAEAAGLERREGQYAVRLAGGDVLDARTVVLATGARYRTLDLPRASELEGSSVYYAATPVELQVCRMQPVVVVGGGNSAGQAAVFLARHVSRVRLVVRHDELTRDMSRYLADRVEHDPHIDVLLGAEVRELLGGHGVLEAVVVEHSTGQRSTLEARALFVFIGAEPHTQWLTDTVARDERGFVLTGEAAARERAGADAHDQGTPMPLETSWPGVFAVGDVRRGSARRLAAAVGEGAMAVRLVHEHLAGTSASSAG